MIMNIYRHYEATNSDDYESMNTVTIMNIYNHCEPLDMVTVMNIYSHCEHNREDVQQWRLGHWCLSVVPLGGAGSGSSESQTRTCH